MCTEQQLAHTAHVSPALHAALAHVCVRVPAHPCRLAPAHGMQ